MLEQRKLDEQLFSAVTKRRPKLDRIKYLIGQGANVNAKFGRSRKTLAHAVKGVSTLVLLAENGLHLGSVDRGGENRLHYAEKRNTPLGLIKAFIELSSEDSGALLDQRRTYDGATPLMVLASSGESKQKLEKMQLLIDNGSDVNAAVKKNRTTALHKAAKYGYLKAAELLIENGASVDAMAKLKLGFDHRARHVLPIDLYQYHAHFEDFRKNSKARTLLRPTLPRVLNSNAEYRPYRDKVR